MANIKLANLKSESRKIQILENFVNQNIILLGLYIILIRFCIDL